MVVESVRATNTFVESILCFALHYATCGVPRLHKIAE